MFSDPSEMCNFPEGKEDNHQARSLEKQHAYVMQITCFSCLTCTRSNQNRRTQLIIQKTLNVNYFRGREALRPVTIHELALGGALCITNW